LALLLREERQTGERDRPALVYGIGHDHLVIVLEEFSFALAVSSGERNAPVNQPRWVD
jgi:hypothetical protein